MATDAYDRLDAAIREHNPVGVYSLFSGGDDSLTALQVARQHPAFTAAVHIDTGIGVWDDPDDRRSVARKFCERFCESQKIPLLIYEAAGYCRADGTPDPQVYEQLVLAHGFPGANEVGHRKMYNRLKERQLRQLMRQEKPRRQDRAMLVAGCRHGESARRMGTRSVVDVQGTWVWCNPIIDWTKPDCLSCIKTAGLERNPCALTIHRSGECMCGAFAQKGELDCELKLFYPDFVAWLKDLEQRVWDAGFPWPWDGSPPKWWKQKNKGQAFFWEMEPERPMPMCQSCVEDQT